MKCGYFEAYITDAQGNPASRIMRLHRRYEILDYFSMRCPHMDLNRVKHFVELARIAPNGPGVDVTQWHNGRMVFSARLRFKMEI